MRRLEADTLRVLAGDLHEPRDVGQRAAIARPLDRSQQSPDGIRPVNELIMRARRGGDLLSRLGDLLD